MSICCRPYLYTTIVSAVVTVPFLLVKASIFDRPSYHPPAIFLFLDFLGFSLLHILVARKVVGWTRNRYKLGLLGQSYPWQVSRIHTCPNLLYVSVVIGHLAYSYPWQVSGLQTLRKFLIYLSNDRAPSTLVVDHDFQHNFLPKCRG